MSYKGQILLALRRCLCTPLVFVVDNILLFEDNISKASHSNLEAVFGFI
jgi:hypothetical protein